MSLGQLMLPVCVRAPIAPSHHALQLLIRPRIKIDGLDARDVRAHAAVDATASDADEDAEVPGGPARVLVAFAVGACLVRFQLHELFERRAVLLRAVGARSPDAARHDGCRRLVIYRSVRSCLKSGCGRPGEVHWFPNSEAV